MKKSSVKLNYLYNLGYQILALVLPLITTPYISRVLGDQMIGRYSYTLSVATYFLMFGNLGIATYAQLKISSTRDNEIECSKLFWELFLTRSITMIISFFAYICLAFSSKEYKQEFIALSILLLSGLFDITWFFQGLEEFKIIVLRNSIVKLVCLILIFALVKDESDLIVYILIMQGSTLIGNISLWPYCKKYIKSAIKFKFHFKFHIKQCLIFFIPTFAASMYTYFDKVLIEWITHSSEQNAYYEQAHKIEQMTIVVITSLNTVLLPKMAYLNKKKNSESYFNQVYLTLKIVMILAFPMAAGLFCVSDKLIPWFLGSEFMPSIPLLKIFSFLIICTSINTIIGCQCLLARERQRQYNTALILGSASNVLFNILFIPKVGALGAAAGTVLAEVCIFIIFYINTKGELNYIRCLKIAVKPLIATLIMIGALLIFNIIYPEAKTIYLVLEVIVGIVVYVISLFLLKDKLFLEVLQRGKNILK